MKTKKNTTEELQASYKAMIDEIEKFVTKEGKTLQQAFHSAEEKLIDAKEISKDKIEQASKDLKENFQIIGDAVEGVSEAYKNQIKLELSFINSSIWDKLQSIADSNTVELIAFTKSLREKTQDILTEKHLTSHQEHSQWNSEHDLWLDEIELWKKDHEQAIIKLAKIEKAMKQHSTSMIEHAQAIKVHAKTEHEHEKTMANTEQDLSSELLKEADDKVALLHQKERQIHKQQSKLHSALKTHHFKTMAMVNMLYKEINKTD
jgi:hypothetical protein